MHPVVDIGLGGHHVLVTAYRLAFVGALVLVPVTALLVARRLGLPMRRVAAVLVAAGAAAVAGARLLAVTLSHGGDAAWAERVGHLGAGDFALYGGLILGGIAGLVVARALGLDPLRTGDAVAPAVGVGIALMRAGCFLAGCCFGEETSVAWGVTYPAGSPAHLAQIGGDPITAVIRGPAPVHPIPLYEIGVAVAGVAIVAAVLRWRVPAGAALAAFVAWYSLWRLVLQPVRAVSDASAAPGWLWPSVFALAAVGSIGYLVRMVAHPRRVAVGA